MRSSKARALGALVTFLLLSGCTDDAAFRDRVEASRAQGLAQVSQIKSGLPFFTKRQMDPVWQPASQENLARVERTELTDHLGNVQTEKLFREKPAFVVFFFARCPGICPMIVANLKRIESQIGNAAGARYLAISVDPKNDSPDVLREYAKKMNVNGKANWSFLTGDLKEITRLQHEVFTIEYSQKPDGRIVHSERVFAVDENGYVRSILNSTDDAAPAAARKIALELTKK